MAATKSKQTKQEKLPARRAAEVVLLNNGKPMHYREISRVALEQGIVKVKKGAKPEQTEKTIRSYLAGCAAEKVNFKRLDKGVFDLTAARRKALVKEIEQGDSAAASKS